LAKVRNNDKQTGGESKKIYSSANDRIKVIV